MFVLDQCLTNDTHLVTEWNLCQVLLMNDKTYPWLILVPRVPGVAELHDLDEASQVQLMLEMTQCSKALAAEYQPRKMNVGALGNIVNQLHLHIIARFEDDPAWPGPIWGVQPPVPYGSDELATTLARLKPALL